MAVQSVPAHRFVSTDLMQKLSGNPPPLLQLPIELLTCIGQYAATGPFLGESAKNAIRLSRVCVLTYQASLHEETQEIVKAGEINAGAEELAKAIVNRQMTVFEMCRFGSSSEPPQRRSEEKVKIHALYAIFRKTAVKPENEENTNAFARQSLAIQRYVRKCCLEMTKQEILEDFSESWWPDAYTIETKIRTALRSFTEKTIKDIIADYVSQPLEEITRENFDDLSARIQNLFEEVRASWDVWPQEFYPTFIEYRIRKEIFRKHESEQFRERVGGHFVFNPWAREWMSYGKNVVY